MYRLADLRALGGVSPDEHDVGAPLGQRPRGDAADAVRGAGDDAELAFHGSTLPDPSRLCPSAWQAVAQGQAAGALNVSVHASREAVALGTDDGIR